MTAWVISLKDSGEEGLHPGLNKDKYDSFIDIVEPYVWRRGR